MKYGFIRVAAATPRIKVADPEYNARSVIECMGQARDAGVKILVFPELCLTGATCGDLFFQSTLIDGAKKALDEVIVAAKGSDMLVFVGLPVSHQGRLYNCAAAVHRGELRAIIPKTNLSDSGESRWFSSGSEDMNPWFADTLMYGAYAVHAVPVGTDVILRCEEMLDIAVSAVVGADLFAPMPLSGSHCQAGATVIVNLAADPETVSTEAWRRTMLTAQSARLNCAYIYANAGYGESTTDLVYVGHNVIAENGKILAESEPLAGMVVSEIDVARLAFARRRGGQAQVTANYRETPMSFDVTETALTRKILPKPFVPDDAAQLAERCEKALKLQSVGLVRRMEHIGIERLVLGVSGGLDSTLAALVCVRALDMLNLPRENLVAITMPCFGTTERTKSSAMLLAEALGATLRIIDIGEAVKQHFIDIGHDIEKTDVVYENAQARERTQVLMDVANACGGLVVGTGNMSELALGWATFNGDHMAMYGVNAGAPKTFVRAIVTHCADTSDNAALSEVLRAVLNTPVSPELLPANDDDIAQITENLVGPYELHDFFLYYSVRWGFEPQKVLYLAKYAFDGAYDDETILKWLRTFYWRFFSQQFKRSTLPDGPKIGSLGVSPRGGLVMPSDASVRLWLDTLS